MDNFFAALIPSNIMSQRLGGGRIKQQQLNIVDRPLSKGKNEVSSSAFCLLFSEMVQYSQKRVSQISELETRLQDAGYDVGVRMLELCCYREKNCKRETRVVGILGFVSNTVWKVLFGKGADSVERVTEEDRQDEFMINERDPLVTRYISVPKDLEPLHPGAFVAGVVKGVLHSAGFPARVTAHFVPSSQPGPNARPRTTILIKFDPEVMQRERSKS